MGRIIRVLAAATAAVALLAAASCGDDDNETDPKQSGASPGADIKYGKCTVNKDFGKYQMTPTSAGVLTVQTNLPSPGWWRGDSPESIEGGYEYCTAANIAYRTGLTKVNVVNVSFDALVAGQTDKFDVAMAQISITPEREKVVDFSAPYFASNAGIMAKKGSGITEANVQSKRLGAAVGTTGATLFRDKIKPSTEPKIFSDTDSMLQAVAAGQIDGAVTDTAILLAFAKQSGGALEVVGQWETGEKYGALYPKGSANAATIDKILADMAADGTFDQLSEQWLSEAFGGDPAKVPMFKLP
jgi:polar amino acid transport system substrate-binding protein